MTRKCSLDCELRGGRFWHLQKIDIDGDILPLALKNHPETKKNYIPEFPYGEGMLNVIVARTSEL